MIHGEIGDSARDAGDFVTDAVTGTTSTVGEATGGLVGSFGSAAFGPFFEMILKLAALGLAAWVLVKVVA